LPSFAIQEKIIFLGAHAASTATFFQVPEISTLLAHPAPDFETTADFL
jgi:hypothetical protein